MNKALPLFDATGSSVMFPDSLATECALSDSRLKQKRLQYQSYIHLYVQQVNDLVKKNPYEIFVTHLTHINSIKQKPRN